MKPVIITQEIQNKLKEDLDKKVINFKDYNTIIDKKVEAYIEFKNQIGIISNVDARNTVNTELKALKSIRKQFKDLRLDITRTIDEYKNMIINHENVYAEDLDNIIKNTISELTTFDTAEERKRQEKIAEEKRKLEKELAQEAEKQKTIDKLQAALERLTTKTIEASTTNTEEKFNELKNYSNKVHTWLFGNETALIELEFFNDFQKQHNKLKGELTQIQKRIEEYEEEIKEKSKEEIEKIKKEAEQKRKEAELLAKKELEKKQIELAEQKEKEFKESQKQIEKIRKLEEEKLKNINKGFDIEIEDLEKIPDKYLKKELKKREARKDIKSGIYIEGLIVRLKDDTILPKEDYKLL